MAVGVEHQVLFSRLVFLRSSTETDRDRVAVERSGACPQAQAQREAPGTQLRVCHHRDLPHHRGREVRGRLVSWLLYRSFSKAPEGGQPP